MKFFSYGLLFFTWIVSSTPILAQPLFSLERGSSTLVQFGLSPADLFVDDTVAGGPPNVELPASGLGLPFTANIDGLSSGRDNAGLAWKDNLFLIPIENPLNSQRIFYYFSVNPSAQDQMPPGRWPIPHFPATLGPTISSTNRFAGAFSAGTQASDVFQNWGTEVMRTNELFIPGAALDLIDGDDLDALSDLGFFGGDLDGRDQDGQQNPDGVLDENVSVFFSVGPGSGNLNPGTVYQVTGSGPITPFANPGQIGLAAGDDIDALCIYDDLVVFSLRAGSPSLPVSFNNDPNGVQITQGGILLAQLGVGLLTGLPASYFGLQDSDELNALHCIDPDPSEVVTCDTESVFVPEDAIAGKPVLIDLEPGERSKVIASLPTSLRGPVDFGVSGYKVFASIEDSSIARLVDSSVLFCGPDGPGGDCFECGSGDSEEPCGEASDSIMAFRLEPPVQGRDLCLGDFTLEGIDPGITQVTLEATVFGPEGEPISTVAQKSLVVVESKEKEGDKSEDPSSNDDY